MFEKKGNYRSDSISESSQFNSLNEIVNFSIEHDIELVFFESPLHQTFTDIVNEFGFSDDYKRWKSDIKSFIDKNNNDKIHFVELEFSQSIINEKIPDEGMSTQMQWFWEPSHYKKELGDKILDLIFEHEGK